MARLSEAEMAEALRAATMTIRNNAFTVGGETLVLQVSAADISKLAAARDEDIHDIIAAMGLDALAEKRPS